MKKWLGDWVRSIPTSLKILWDALVPTLSVIFTALLLLGCIGLIKGVLPDEIGNDYYKQMLGSQISPVLTSSALIMGVVGACFIVIVNHVDALGSFVLNIVRVSLSFAFTTTFFESYSCRSEGNSQWSALLSAFTGTLGTIAVSSILFLYIVEVIVAFRKSEAYKDVPEFIEFNCARWLFSGTTLCLTLGGCICSIVQYATKNHSGSTLSWFLSEYSVMVLFAVGVVGSVLTLVVLCVTQERKLVRTVLATFTCFTFVSWATLHLESGLWGIKTQVQQTSSNNMCKKDTKLDK